MIFVQDGGYYLTRNNKTVGPAVERNGSRLVYPFHIDGKPYTWMGEATVGRMSGDDLVKEVDCKPYRLPTSTYRPVTFDEYKNYVIGSNEILDDIAYVEVGSDQNQNAHDPNQSQTEKEDN